MSERIECKFCEKTFPKKSYKPIAMTMQGSPVISVKRCLFRIFDFPNILELFMIQRKLLALTVGKCSDMLNKCSVTLMQFI